MPGLTAEERSALSTTLDRLAPTGADPDGPATLAAVSLLLRELATDADAQDPLRPHGKTLAERIWTGSMTPPSTRCNTNWTESGWTSSDSVLAARWSANTGWQQPDGGVGVGAGGFGP